MFRIFLVHFVGRSVKIFESLCKDVIFTVAFITILTVLVDDVLHVAGRVGLAIVVDAHGAVLESGEAQQTLLRCDLFESIGKALLDLKHLSLCLVHCGLRLGLSDLADSIALLFDIIDNCFP